MDPGGRLQFKASNPKRSSHDPSPAMLPLLPFGNLTEPSVGSARHFFSRKSFKNATTDAHIQPVQLVAKEGGVSAMSEW
jgi:hypothetical protein